MSFAAVPTNRWKSCHSPTRLGLHRWTSEHLRETASQAATGCQPILVTDAAWSRRAISSTCKENNTLHHARLQSHQLGIRDSLARSGYQHPKSRTTREGAASRALGKHVGRCQTDLHSQANEQPCVGIKQPSKRADFHLKCVSELPSPLVDQHFG